MCSVRAEPREPVAAQTPVGGLKRIAVERAAPAVSPPAIRTSPFGSTVEVCRRRSAPMVPCAAQVPVNGSYISTDVRKVDAEPPATMILPEGRRLAVWAYRPAVRTPPDCQVPVPTL